MVKRLLALVCTLGVSEIVRWSIARRERAIRDYREGKIGSTRLALLAGSAGVAEAQKERKEA